METPARNAEVRNAEVFRAWLNRAGSVEELLEWCRFGFGSGRDRIPHEQLAAALPAGKERGPMARELARRVAGALSSVAANRFSKDQEQELLRYNLLALAALLDCPAELHTPLWSYHAVLAQDGCRLPEETRVALADALINNQLFDEVARTKWRAMAEGKADPVLGTSLELGCHGLIQMPGAPRAKYPFDEESVGIGLRMLAVHYGRELSTRRQFFRRQVMRAKTLWKMIPETLVHLAHKYEWVKEAGHWTIDALCDQFTIDFGAVKNGKRFWLVWHWFARCFEAWGEVEVKGKKLCGGCVLQVEITDAAATHCRAMQKSITDLLPKQPDIRESEALGRIGQILDRYKAYAEQNQKASKTPGAMEAIRQVKAEFQGSRKTDCPAPKNTPVGV